MEHFEHFICMAGLVLFACLPIWYWGFAGKGHFYDYQDAKKIMEKKVVHDHRLTIYCGASFDADKNIYPDYGFALAGAADAQRQAMNWEHAVPVAEFGQNFYEWREGAPECVHKGRPFKGRKCAELANKMFRRMAGDMYNLFPAIAAVNSARGDKRYAELPNIGNSFGSCAAKVTQCKFEPPDAAKGQVARAVLYMDANYDSFELEPAQKKLFNSWNSQFQVDEWECLRAKRIEKIQGNENVFVKKPCVALGVWN